MRISQIEFLIAVEKAGSINLAANQLFVAQSLISSSIKSLEEELGQPLFTRTNKGVKLTSFGKEFLPYARSVVVQINQMKSLAKTGGSPSATLSICSNNFKFAVDLVAELYKRHEGENIHIAIKDCSRQESIEMISNHMAEAALVRIWSFQATTMLKQLKSKNVLFFPCIILPTAVVIGPNNPYFNHTDRLINPKLLKGFPAVVFDYAQYNPNTTIHEQIPELEVRQFISVSSRNAATEILQQTNAYFLIAASSQPGKNVVEDYPGCRILEISNCEHTAQLGYLKHRDSNFSPLAQEYVDALTSYLYSR